MQTRRDSGFTLAELLVATTLTAIVMTAVYASFSSLTLMWRAGSGDDRAYQEARTAMSLLQRELQCHVPQASHLIEGSDDSLLFYAVAPPMNVDEGPGDRLLQIEYDLVRGTGKEGARLVRREAIVTTPLPTGERDGFGELVGRIDTGRDVSFNLAGRVKDLNFEYWRVPKPIEKTTADGLTFEEQDPVIFDRIDEGDGLPQAIRITLTLENLEAEDEISTFETFVVFRGPTEEYEPGDALGGAGRFQ